MKCDSNREFRESTSLRSLLTPCVPLRGCFARGEAIQLETQRIETNKKPSLSGASIGCCAKGQFNMPIMTPARERSTPLPSVFVFIKSIYFISALSTLFRFYLSPNFQIQQVSNLHQFWRQHLTQMLIQRLHPQQQLLALHQGNSV